MSGLLHYLQYVKSLTDKFLEHNPRISAKQGQALLLELGGWAMSLPRYTPTGNNKAA